MKQAAIYGICGGLLIASLQFVEYRLVILEGSYRLYALAIASAFAAVGVGLGLRARGREIVVKEVPIEVRVPVPVEVPAPAGPFEPDASKIEALGITPRELEVLQLIAEGLSTREMAERLFVSENTVKTHTSRVLDKLGASHRTQAVQLAKQMRLLA